MIDKEVISMAKVLRSLKSALGLRSTEKCSLWRWVLYHHL